MDIYGILPILREQALARAERIAMNRSRISCFLLALAMS
jgi:hypothetical protein